MAITEETRHHLFQRLDEVIGEEDAVTLMEHLPPVGWADVATKADIDHLRSDMTTLHESTSAEIASLRREMTTMHDSSRADIENLRASTSAEIRALRTTTKADIESLRTSTQQDISGLGALLRQEMAENRAEIVTTLGSFREEIRSEQRHMTRQVVIVLLGAVITMLIATAELM